MLTIVCNYTIQQTAPGIALDVAFVLAGDGRTLAQHIDDIDAGLPWDFISPQSPNPLSPAKSLRKRPLGEKKICQNIPKYPWKKTTSWCLKMGYTGIPFQTIENGLFFARGAVLLGDTRGNACYALQYAMSTCAKSRIESACGLAGRFPDVFVTAVASALGLKHWQLHHFTTGSKVGLLW